MKKFGSFMKQRLRSINLTSHPHMFSNTFFGGRAMAFDLVYWQHGEKRTHLLGDFTSTSVFFFFENFKGKK